jgi:hypothetical protein
VASNGKSKPKLNGAQAILLRTAKDTRTKNDRSIYRYDRDGLMAALKAARTGS